MFLDAAPLNYKNVTVNYALPMWEKEKIMKQKCILVFMVILTIGMTACSSDSKEDSALTETIAERETENEDLSETETNATESPKSDITEDVGKESATDDENIEGDPITGIVENYADDIIIIKDSSDEMLYYFSTKNAQISEGDSPIAVGDKVEVTYQGLLGDEKNPGEAVKIVAVIVK